MAEESLLFHWADYLVLGLFLVFTTLLGVVIGWRDRKKATAKDFLQGGGDMHYIPVAMSIQMSFISAIYLISTPIEIYMFGTMYSYLGVAYLISQPICAYLYLPIFYKMKLTSAYEYLERRFNRTVRIFGAGTSCVMLIMYLPVVLYTPSIALAQVTGLSVELATGVVGIVCVAYTVIGGMKATIWNDFCQMVVVFSGLICLIVFGSIEVGGLARAWEINVNGSRIEFDDFNPDPTNRMSFWTQVVGGTVITVTMNASSQTVIQKCFSVKKLRDMQKAGWVAVFSSIILLGIVVTIGLLAYAYYATCDPIRTGKVESSDQIIPLFVMDVMGHLPGLPGLFMSSSFSAALSSLSGSLNALAAITLIDFIRPIYFNTKGVALSERTSSILSRCLALGYGVLVIALGFVVPFLGSIVLQISLSIFGFAGGPVLALISLGIFTPFVNSHGALAALIVSLIVACWIGIGSIVAQVPSPILLLRTDGCPVEITNFTTIPVTPYTGTTEPEPAEEYLWVYKISYMYYGTVALIVAFIVGPIVSLITGRAKSVPAKLTFRFGKYCCCYCPSGCKKCLRCGTMLTEDDSEDDEIKIVPDDIKNNGLSPEGVDNVAWVPCKEMYILPADAPNLNLDRQFENITSEKTISYANNISPVTLDTDRRSVDSDDSDTQF